MMKIVKINVNSDINKSKTEERRYVKYKSVKSGSKK